MKFDNAKTGIKRIYTAEVLSIIAAIVAIVAAVLLVILGSFTKDGKVNVTDVISTISLVVAGIIGVVAYIMNIVGISTASKDSEDFKNALYMAIGAILTSVVSSLLQKSSPSFAGALQVSENIFEMLTAYYVINGCTNLAKQIGNAAVEAEGKKTMKLFITVWIVSIVVETLGKIVERASKTQVLTIIAGILSIAALVLGLICYIIFLKLLRKTIDIL